MIESPNKDLWIGTEGGGLNYYNNKTGEFSYFLNNPKDKNSLSSNNVKCIIQDRDGNLWIGTHDGGLDFLNPNKKPFKFKHYNDAKRYGVNTAKDQILTLLEDKNRNIWIGTTSNGILYYNRKTDKVMPIGKGARFINLLYQSKDLNYIILNNPNGLKNQYKH